MNEFKVGDKVIPIKRTVPGYTEKDGYTRMYERGDVPYLYVVKIYDESHAHSIGRDARGIPVYAVNHDPHASGGNYFYGEGLQLVGQASTSSDPFTRFVRGEISERAYINGGEPVGFELGARVLTKPNLRVGNTGKQNVIGTIIAQHRRGRDWLVEFDEYVDGHDGHGSGTAIGRNGHCWFVPERELKLI